MFPRTRQMKNVPKYGYVEVCLFAEQRPSADIIRAIDVYSLNNSIFMIFLISNGLKIMKNVMAPVQITICEKICKLMLF